MNTHNDIIVGLAGHIDHGKTTLIKALNGFDGDSLLEEKQRGITIDLSFSSLTLPSRNVAFIDVPGHNKLVKNMIAGAFGIDVLLLVIAADDGIMPQSLEHLYIADHLGISTCVCVITKIDKAQSKTQIENLKTSISALFEKLDITLHSIIESNPTNPLDPSLQTIKSTLDNIPKPPKTDFGLFLYYIDRAFALKGAGCVVTGSVLSGQCKVGQKLYVYHTAQEVGIRNIEIHDKPASIATPSHRVALNLTHTSHDKLKRGYLLSQKGFLRGFNNIDVGLFGNLKHNAIYQLYIGSAKHNAKVQILSNESISHSFGQKPLILATLKCDQPIFSVFSQRFILRNDEGEVCGGIVLNPIIDPIKKQTRLSLLQALANKNFEKSFEILIQIHKKGFGLVSSTQRFSLSHEQSLQIASKLQNVFVDEKALTLYPSSQLEVLKTFILEIFMRNKSALLSAQSLNTRAKWASPALCQNALNALLNEGFIILRDGLYLSKQCQIKNINEFLQDQILLILTKQEYAPPAPYNIYDELEIDRIIGDNALKALTQAQKVVRIAHNLFITTQALNAIISLMREIIRTHGFVDVSVLKTHLNLSRKYLISYLEYLDKFDDIKREDNKRYLKYTQTK